MLTIDDLIEMAKGVPTKAREGERHLVYTVSSGRIELVMGSDGDWILRDPVALTLNRERGDVLKHLKEVIADKNAQIDRLRH